MSTLSMALGRPRRNIKAAQPKTVPAPISTWASPRILVSRSSAATKSVDSFLGLLLVAVTGWNDNYNETERRQIIDSLPERYRKYEIDPETGGLLCPINTNLILDNHTLKQAIITIREEIKEGYYETTWLNSAAKATDKRKNKLFDKYLRQSAQEQFGQPSEPDAHASEEENAGFDSTSDGEYKEKTATRKKQCTNSNLLSSLPDADSKTTAIKVHAIQAEKPVPSERRSF